MALFIKQDEQRSELQKRIAAEINRKSRDKSLVQDKPDGVDDSQYIKNTKTTTSLAWVWAIIVIAVVAVIIWLTVASMAI